MKCFRLFFILVITCFSMLSSVLGKEVKPKVMVYGDNIQAFAAALQSAGSNVPTLLVTPSKAFCSNCFSLETLKIVKDTLGGGMWATILKEVSMQESGMDSSTNRLSYTLDPQVILKAMHSLIAKEKNLNIIYQHSVKKVVNNSKSVEVELSNKKKFTLNAVVDLSEDLALVFASDAGVSINKKNAQPPSTGRIVDLDNNILRTLVAVGYSDDELYGHTVRSILNGSVRNLFFNGGEGSISSANTNIEYQLNIGQAIGASAAYCAFFKTTSDKIDVRKLQAELLSFGSRLLPFADISVDDPNFNALQKFFLTEILPWDKNSQPFYFNGSDSVSVASVKPILQQYYSRSQLWFIENRSVFFTVKDVIELIKVISFRSDELDEEVRKAWGKRFKFSREFDLNLLISRYEFAVLMDAYANPFGKTISLDGAILR